ncbi:hypothetical protein Moror_14374, partial [Moniliophthora roreri MCA 2997]
VYGAPTIILDPLEDHSDSKQLPISWIWYTISFVGKSDTEVAEKEEASTEQIEASLCVEWCKACAQAHQSREELILLEEEMCRSIQFSTLSWHAEGLTAYAAEQAYIEHAQAEAWTN